MVYDHCKGATTLFCVSPVAAAAIRRNLTGIKLQFAASLDALQESQVIPKGEVHIYLGI